MTVIYEHPITEHAKWLKRIEVTYSKIENLIKSRRQHVFANIIFLMIELETLVSGQENRTDIQKILNKKKSFLVSLSSNPDVNYEILEKTLEELEEADKRLRCLEVPPGNNLQKDHFIQLIKFKYNIKGPLYDFELPHLNYWIHQELELQLDRIEFWLEDLIPIVKAAELILRISRKSGQKTICTAENGFYQYVNEKQTNLDLMQIKVHPNLLEFPEITGNKHKFLIRFLEEKNTQVKPQQATKSIKFELFLITL